MSNANSYEILPRKTNVCNLHEDDPTQTPPERKPRPELLQDQNQRKPEVWCEGFTE
jgi:hypothetical protein